MSDRSSYRSLMTDRITGPLLAATNFGRLSGGLVPFGLVAFYSDRNEYLHAGVMSSAFMIISSLTAPYKGRLITRYSPLSTLLPLSLAFALITVTGIALDINGGAFPFAFIGVCVGAALVPPTPALVRAMWTAIATSTAMKRALHSLDSTTEELTFAISPLIIAALWSSVGPFWSIPLGLIAGVIGNVAILWWGMRPYARCYRLVTEPLPVSDKSDDASIRRRRVLSVYRQRKAAGLLIPMLALGLAIGSLSLILPPWCERNLGAASISGVLLSIISFTGFLTGLCFGKFPENVLQVRTQYRLSVAFIVGAVALLTMGSGIVTAVVACILLGVGMTPMFIASFLLVSSYFATDTHTEMNAALGSSFNLGSGTASLIAGLALSQLGPSTVLIYVSLILVILGGTVLLLPHVPDEKELQK